MKFALAITVSVGLAFAGKKAHIKPDLSSLLTNLKMDTISYKPNWCDTAITSSFTFHGVADSVQVDGKTVAIKPSTVQVFYRRTKPNCY